MKTTLKALLVLAAIAATLSVPAFAEEGQSIYVPDNRVEYFAAAADMKVLSDSVVSSGPPAA